MKLIIDGVVVQVRHLQKKNGSYYYNPSWLMRRAGFKAEPLGDEKLNLDWDRRPERVASVRKKLRAFAAARRASRPGSLVYFVTAGDGIKIGVTRSLAKRLQTLQTASARPLRLIGTTPGGEAEERALHDRLKQYRRHGEWFDDSQDVRTILSEYPPACFDPA